MSIYKHFFKEIFIKLAPLKRIMKKRSRKSIEKGLGFGLTSGVITTLGLMVGLDAGTHSSLAVTVGVFAIAISDAMSDALGIHTAEEVANNTSEIAQWETTFATFLSKFIFTLTFAIPLLLFPLEVAIIASILWGLSLIGLFSYHIANVQKKNPLPLITSHVVLALLVIILTHYVGKFAGYLGSLV